MPIRPSVAVSATETNEDDLTIKLNEIITINELVKKSINEGFAFKKLLEDW